MFCKYVFNISNLLACYMDMKIQFRFVYNENVTLKFVIYVIMSENNPQHCGM